MALAPLEKKLEDRLRVLNTSYDLTNGDSRAMLGTFDVAANIGMQEEDVAAAVRYLAGEGLIRTRGSNPGTHFTMEHAGIVEVEKARLHPTQPTEHFPVSVVNLVINGPVGVVQTGAGGIAHVQQTLDVDLEALLQQLKNAVPPGRVELHEAVEDLRDEVAKPEVQRRTSKIRAYLTTALGYGKDLGTVAHLALEIAKMLGVPLS
jgi:hypothetical protein